MGDGRRAEKKVGSREYGVGSRERDAGWETMTEATRGYRELIAWQKAIQLVPAVYRLVKQLPAEERYALSDQLRRALHKSPGIHAIRHSRVRGCR
jgi:hypothetical protein